MIIELQSANGLDEYSIDTETASREELAKACVTLHRWWTHIGKLIDEQGKALTDLGLHLDEASDFPLKITDKETATAWFELALARTDFDEADDDD